jgi:hypothetical protein
MLLEYFDDTSLARPVLLLYGNDPTEATALRDALGDLAAGVTRDLDVLDLPGFRGIDGCSLIAHVGEKSVGIEPMPGSLRSFRCSLDLSDWQLVSDLLEPFATGTGGSQAFQYLTEAGIEWIISTHRGW